MSDDRERQLRIMGVYAIRNIVSGRIYVGSTSRLNRRWADHKSLLERGKHHSRRLQRSWTKHGPSAFSFEILEQVDSLRDLLVAEQTWIDRLNAACQQRGFNVLPLAGKSAGRLFSRGIRLKMGASQRGRKHSAEHIAKAVAARAGYRPTEEHKRIISWFHKGKLVSEATRAKQSASQRSIGKVMSSEARARISAANRGHTVSEEVRARISCGLKGLKRGPMSDEHKAKIRAAQKRRLG